MNLEMCRTRMTDIFPLETFHWVDNLVAKSSLNSPNGAPRSQVLSEIICGPEKGLKTSLLFQAGVSHCDSGNKVIFICAKALDTLPLNIHGMTVPSLDIMYLMKLIYIDDTENLLKFLAVFHSQKIAWPSLIILDNFDYYLEQYKDTSSLEQSCAKLCAILVEVADFCSKKLGTPCDLLLSCNRTELCVKIFHIFHHFFDRVWNIHLTEDRNHTAFSIAQLSGKPSVISRLLVSKRKDEILLRNVFIKKK